MHDFELQQWIQPKWRHSLKVNKLVKQCETHQQLLFLSKETHLIIGEKTTQPNKQ